MNNKYRKNTTQPAQQVLKKADSHFGKLYGVGTGPGRPELMTLLAVETIRKCHVIAVPTAQRDAAASYRTAAAVIPEISEYDCLTLDTPMTKDIGKLDAAYQKAAEAIMQRLRSGEDVAYLVLGDPSVYSTYIYIHRIVRSFGFDTEIISGVTSFCAAAARIGDSLADRSEQLHIIPSSYDTKEALALPGTKVFMKAASRIGELKKELMECCTADALMIENCGMPDERIYYSPADIPESSGYFSIVIVTDCGRAGRACD